MSLEAGESWEQAGRLERAGSELKQGEQGWEAGESWEQAGVRGASWEAGES